MSKVHETMKLAKELYKHSIVIDDAYLEEKILKVITNLAIISENFILTRDKSLISETSEIERVKRKVPMWLVRTHQANYKILTAYMSLSNNNERPVNIEELVSFEGIEKKTFLGHYNGMKIISAKNHAKVFEEEHKMIKLWEPVKDFLVKIYKGKSNVDKFISLLLVNNDNESEYGLGLNTPKNNKKFYVYKNNNEDVIIKPAEGMTEFGLPRKSIEEYLINKQVKCSNDLSYTHPICEYIEHNIKG